MRWLTEAIRLDAKEPRPIATGCRLREKGDTHKAIADFTEAIRLNPKLASAIATELCSLRHRRV